MSQLFPSEKTTYLPTEFSEYAQRAFGFGQYGPICEEIGRLAITDYERVGVDRALAIALDLATTSPSRQLRILDIGCSTGMIAKLLSACGYSVTGIDPNAKPYASRTLKVLRSDLDLFLSHATDTFDVGLLLSVLHWLPGDNGRIPGAIKELCRRIRSHLYVEVPLSIESEEFQDLPGAMLYPHAFVDHQLAVGFEWIGSTIATNGKKRRLYRVDLR